MPPRSEGGVKDTSCRHLLSGAAAPRKAAGPQRRPASQASRTAVNTTRAAAVTALRWRFHWALREAMKRHHAPPLSASPHVPPLTFSQAREAAAVASTEHVTATATMLVADDGKKHALRVQPWSPHYQVSLSTPPRTNINTSTTITTITTNPSGVDGVGDDRFVLPPTPFFIAPPPPLSSANRYDPRRWSRSACVG